MTIKKHKKNRGRKVFFALLIACILIPIVAYCSKLIYLLYLRPMHTIVNTNKSSDNAENTVAAQSGIENIVLFGVDSRTSTDPGNTDSIIIATMDMNTKSIKLASIMRDLYVEIGNTKSKGRVNSAYSKGGPELALETLNSNFGLDLQYYAIIDFHAFQDLIDKIGGIDVDVKDYEVSEINKYIGEVNGKNSTFLKSSGLQHLNGQQALSYSRIRHVGNSDFERTERQRTVLKCVVEKVKKTNILSFPQLLTTLVSYTQTNVPLSKIISLGTTAYRFNNNIQTIRVPVDGYYKNKTIGGADVLVPDISANAQFLRGFITGINTPIESKPEPKVSNNANSNISSGGKEKQPKVKVEQNRVPGKHPAVSPKTPKTEKKVNSTP